MDVQFEVKLSGQVPQAQSLGENKKSVFIKSGGNSALAKMALSHQVSPIHTRGITILGNEKFDQSYLEPKS